MTANTWTVYEHLILTQLTTGGINLNTVTPKCALITSATVPNANTDTTWSAAAYTEVSGAGYTAGGITLTGPRCTLVNVSGTNKSTLTYGGPFEWAQNGAGFSNAAYAVIYDPTSGLLIAYSQFAAAVGNTAAALDLAFTTVGGTSQPVFQIG